MSHHDRRLASVLGQLAPVSGVRSSLAASACATHAASTSLQAGGRLAGRVCVITGAGSGIGRASALLFAVQGAKLMLGDRALASVEETKALVLAQTPSAEVAVRAGDVSEVETNERLVADAIALYGTLHVFFANAGVVGSMAPFTSITPEAFRRTLEVNVIGAFLGMQAAAKYMVTQPRDLCGSIVCTSSVAGLRSGAGPADYSSSKAALSNLVQTMANELAGKNIRINAVAPGLIETGMTDPLFSAARARHSEHKIGQLNPLRRSGESHEVAAAALFLASEESSYINGQSIMVCGGLSSSLPVPTNMQIQKKA